MRIYKNFGEALGEIKRDLAEMGIRVHPHTMQDKYVADDENYQTLEIQNYGYTVLEAVKSIDQLHPVQPWADAEFQERICSVHSTLCNVNPGEAYKLRPEVWNEFLHHGKFAYTYNERMQSLPRIINELHKNPDSRQCYLPIFWPNDMFWVGSGSNRIPCSLGYLFQIRRNQLDMTYYMRSCDYITHFNNDAYLAVRLMEFVAKEVGVVPGDFCQFMNSLHIYKKDAEGVF